MPERKIALSVLLLGKEEAVPDGTADGTLIVRTTDETGRADAPLLVLEHDQSIPADTEDGTIVTRRTA